MWKRENIGQSNAYLVTDLIMYNQWLLLIVNQHHCLCPTTTTTNININTKILEQANDCLVSNLISYNDVLLVIVILLNMAFCVIVGPKDGYTTTNTILIINANAITAIIINISLMLLDVVFCVIVCPEDGGATQPNKW